MRTTLLLISMTACVAPAESEATQSIVGGTQATSAEFATVVGLLEGGNNWFCTGVLIDKDWVLTSASCFEGINGQTQIRLDDTTLTNNGGRTVAIAEIHKHPEYNVNSTTWSHDIAMLKLAESVIDRTPSGVHRHSVAIAGSVTQVGFGVNNNNGNGGGVLRSLATTTVDCAQAGDSGISNANLLCFNAGDGTGSCYGDGGAPAFFGADRRVAGIGSGGTSSSCTQGLDVYTSIEPEQAFIDTYLPATPPPPPSTDPTMPPPPAPDEETPTDPDEEGKADDDKQLHPVGCAAGGGTSGGLLVIGLALLLRRRRRS